MGEGIAVGHGRLAHRVRGEKIKMQKEERGKGLVVCVGLAVVHPFSEMAVDLAPMARSCCFSIIRATIFDRRHSFPLG
eukprot:m.411977 g.411977  ORF g.411977 m.411977 type:complete len:78 (+) comp28767_c0_seq1:59-292(+)